MGSVEECISTSDQERRRCLIGQVKIDTTTPEKRLYDQYPVHTIEGVRRLFEDIHRIRAARLTKTDYNVSNLLIDFQRAVQQAGLTRRQARALYWYYERDLTERESAVMMGVSRQTLSEYIETALQKIATVFEEWGYFQE